MTEHVLKAAKVKLTVNLRFASHIILPPGLEDSGLEARARQVQWYNIEQTLHRKSSS
jgi:hypothetical protein